MGRPKLPPGEHKVNANLSFNPLTLVRAKARCAKLKIVLSHKVDQLLQQWLKTKGKK